MPYGLAIIRELSDLEPAIKWSTSQRILIEISFLRICSLDMHSEEENLTNRIALLEERIHQIEEGLINGTIHRNNVEINTSQSNIGIDKAIEPPVLDEREVKIKVGNHQKNDKIKENSKQDEHVLTNTYPEWNKVLDDLRSIGRMKILSSLLNATAVSVDENTVGIVLDEGDEYNKRILTRHENIEVIEGSIKRATGTDMSVTVIDNKDKTQEAAPECQKNFGTLSKERSVSDIREE